MCDNISIFDEEENITVKTVADTEKAFEYIKSACAKTFNDSPYCDTVTVNLNLTQTISVIFCNKKPFDCTVKKTDIVFCIKNDYFDMMNPDDIPVKYEIKNINSLKEFTRIFISTNHIEFQKFVNYIFSFCETYVDKYYVPDHLFDCCDRYMECSDAKHCTCPDYLYSKCCTYKNKIENGIIFFGKNRNIK